MTEQQLNELRATMRAKQIELMLEWNTKVLRTVLDMLPEEVGSGIRSALATSLKSQKETLEFMAFDWLPAEWADLVSSENHEQYLAICKDIESKLGLPTAA